MQSSIIIAPSRTPSGMRSYYIDEKTPTAYRLGKLIIEGSVMTLFSPYRLYDTSNSYRIKNCTNALLAELKAINNGPNVMSNTELEVCIAPEQDIVAMKAIIINAIEQLISGTPVPQSILDKFDFGPFGGFVECVNTIQQAIADKTNYKDVPVVSKPFNMPSITKYRDGYLIRITPETVLWKTPAHPRGQLSDFIFGLNCNDVRVAYVINALGVILPSLPTYLEIYRYVNGGNIYTSRLFSQKLPLQNSVHISEIMYVVGNLLHGGCILDTITNNIIESIQQWYGERFSHLFPEAMSLEALDSDTDELDDKNEDKDPDKNNDSKDDQDDEPPEDEKVSVRVPSGSYLINLDKSFETDIDKFLFREEVISLCKLILQDPPESMTERKKQFIEDFIKYWIHLVDDKSVEKFAKNALKYASVNK